MPAQNRRRGHRTDLSFNAHLNGFRLAFVGNNHDQFFGLENLARRHRERARWNLRDVSKPAFADLLAAAGLVEVHDQVRIFSSEISWRIVEGDVPVLSNSQKCNIDGWRCKLLAHFTRDGRRLSGVSFDEMKIADSGLAHQPLRKILAEAGEVSCWQADVFV